MIITNSVKQYIAGAEREFESGHASTLIKLDSGEVLTAWFGGSWEKGADVAIWISRRVNEEWQKPWVIAETRGIALWNPVLFAYEDKIFLYYKEGATISTWRTLVMSSSDQGKSFGAPQELVKGMLADVAQLKISLLFCMMAQ